MFRGIEYFYGSGVQTARPKSTHHGNPMEIIKLGESALPEDIVSEYLDSLKEIYTPEAYDLFAHNCNNFTNDFSMFLVGKGIPDHIVSLPQTVLDTPFGRMLAPQISQAMRPITQAPASRNGRLASIPDVTTPTASLQAIHNVISLSVLKDLLVKASSSSAVIFFTSSTCGPCKIAYPAFDELAEEAASKAILVKVDINQAHDIASTYSIRATPTFMTFLKGQHQETWSGADPTRLRSNVRMLLQAAFPPHPHRALKIPSFLRQSTQYVLFTKTPPLDKLTAKLGTSQSEPAVSAVVSFVKARDAQGAREAPLPDLPLIGTFLRNATNNLAPEVLFAAYDLLRLLLVDARCSAFYAQEIEAHTLRTLLSHVTSQALCPYNLRLVTMQLACNLFSAAVTRHSFVADPTSSTLLVRLVAEGLLDREHGTLRVAAASLAFNIATAVHTARQGETETPCLTDALQVELLASLLEALEMEESADAIKGMVMAVGRLVYLAPEGGEILDLCRALDAQTAVKGKLKIAGVDAKLMKEVGEELLGKGCGR